MVFKLENLKSYEGMQFTSLVIFKFEVNCS